ncbi:MAG: WbqC family protein [Ruminococcus flavefaciens]|nr:WbqC family protein [Ruminococcus flavefaciens]
MRGAIMQPTFLPWLGYFAMIDNVDAFVFLDHVQLEKRSWQVRNRINFNGTERYLTIPVKKQPRDQAKICTSEIADGDWKISHINMMRQAYCKAPYFDEVLKLIEPFYENNYSKLADFTIGIIKAVCKYLGIDTPIYRSSEINQYNSRKDELLVDICNDIGINFYFSALGSANYIESRSDGGAFTLSNIKIAYQHYSHPIYFHGKEEFIPYMGIIDLLFYNGRDSLEVIRSGNRESYTSTEVRGKIRL